MYQQHVVASLDSNTPRPEQRQDEYAGFLEALEGVARVHLGLNNTCLVKASAVP